MRYRDIAAQHNENEKPDSKNYLLQLERDTRAGMLILHILDKSTGKRTEVRGKMGYETNGYDPNDKLHQLLDKVGKSASVSDLMNGDVVSINPRHPDGASAKAATDKAYDEDQHPNDTPRGPETKPTMPKGTVRVDVSDVYDWYKLGQHISNLKGLGKHDFGKGPPASIISFGSEEEEHKFIQYLKQIGLDITDIDPAYHDKKGGVKTDPTYNTESFNTDVEWVSDLNSRNVQVFATKIDDAYIELTYKRIFPADVYISFTRGGRMSVTGEGSQNKIFGAVINHVKQWVAKNNPPRIIFSAFKPNTGPFGSQDTTRSSLYSKMVQRFAGQNGYDYDIENTGSEDTFVLTRKNAEESISEESGKELLKIFRNMHHDTDMNKDMDRFILSHDWELGNFTPDMFPSEEEFFDYDDPFDRVIDIDYNARVNLSAPIIVGPQYKDGKYSVIDGNHRAAAAQRSGKTIKGYFPVEKTNENFADGKKPGRKGLAKRSGVNTKASVSSLRKTAKNSSGEKQRMAHWLANMKAGRKKAAKK